MSQHAKEYIRFYRGNSMRGTFHAGDCLFIQPVSLTEISRGDVIIYSCETGKNDDVKEIVHRVVDLSPDGLITRGDNNYYNDSHLVTDETLVGIVTSFERNSQVKKVYGGRLGLLQARLFFSRQRIWHFIRRWGSRYLGGGYRWLRNSEWGSRLWPPTTQKIHLTTENGTLVKYVCGGRTIALWKPEQGHFECRKPYDLFIQKPDGTK